MEKAKNFDRDLLPDNYGIQCHEVYLEDERWEKYIDYLSTLMAINDEGNIYPQKGKIEGNLFGSYYCVIRHNKEVDAYKFYYKVLPARITRITIDQWWEVYGKAGRLREQEEIALNSFQRSKMDAFKSVPGYHETFGPIAENIVDAFSTIFQKLPQAHQEIVIKNLQNYMKESKVILGGAIKW